MEEGGELSTRLFSAFSVLVIITAVGVGAYVTLTERNLMFQIFGILAVTFGMWALWHAYAANFLRG